jgi:hypothetical protein
MEVLAGQLSELVPGTRRVAAAAQRQQDQPLIYSSLPPGFATYVPRAGTVYTSPSSRRAAIARLAVERATSYVSTSSLSVGMRVSGGYLPDKIPRLIIAAICR